MSSNNSQKLPLALSLNRLAERRVYDVLQNTGKALPCSVAAVTNSIVTVNFEVQNTPFTLPNVTCPMFGPEYIRYPTQVGDKGVVFAADAYLGGVSGLGGGVADLAIRGNLSCLVFFPIANSNWSDTDSPTKLGLYGPDGCYLRDSQSKYKMDIDKTNGAVVTTALPNVLNLPLMQAANDGAAASAGVNVKGLYHNNSAVMIRVS